MLEPIQRTLNTPAAVPVARLTDGRQQRSHLGRSQLLPLEALFDLREPALVAEVVDEVHQPAVGTALRTEAEIQLRGTDDRWGRWRRPERQYRVSRKSATGPLSYGISQAYLAKQIHLDLIK